MGKRRREDALGSKQYITSMGETGGIQRTLRQAVRRDPTSHRVSWIGY